MASRIDAHQHYWQYARGDYHWMSAPGAAPLRRDFLPADLAPALAEARIDRTIVVQAAATLAETEFLLQLARANPSIAGVVGWLDFESERFADELECFARDTKFVGVRPMLQDLPDDRYVLRPRVLENLGELARRGRVLDLLILPRHLAFASEALERVPSLRAVVDHAAKPELAAGERELAAWRDGLSRLARRGDVYCKLSGLVTEAPPGTPARAFAPVVEHVLAAFGEERVLFGSDWPVCTLRTSYRGVIELVAEVLGAALGGDFEQRLFGDAASACYRL